LEFFSNLNYSSVNLCSNDAAAAAADDDDSNNNVL
jgi:hypothetical protein